MATASVVTVLVAASLVAACSQEDQTESASATDTPEAPAAATSEPTVSPSPTQPPPNEAVAEAPQASPSTVPVQSEPVAPTTQRSITIGGMGADYGPPDRTVVDLGVSSRSNTVIESTSLASSAGASMIVALEASGVPAEDIQTSQFNIGPYHGPPDYSAVVGYETTIGYRVTMRNLDELGAILGRAVEAGGDNVRAWSVRFEADPEARMVAARSQAWEDVRARAASTAAEIGEPLGVVLDVHEKVLVTSPQGMSQGGEGDSASFDIPVSPGVVGVVVLLTVTYAIGD